MLSIKTPKEVSQELAQRLRNQRLALEWSREELAKRSGVSVASLKRFELTGEISLLRLLTLCLSLNALSSFDGVLMSPKPRTMAEVKRLAKTRLRGRRSKR